MSEFELPEWAKNANIYEVNIRQFTPEGTFNAFRNHLPRLKDMGVDILWFMPIFPISRTKKKGSLGSYYAVTDYRSANPSFGTLEQFAGIISQAHRLGMRVILDWVPNHTGWDHIWLKSHPEYYTQDADGNIVDPHDDFGKSLGWADVADLNYNNQELWRTMIDDMKYWLEEFNIDGFRQDMAMLVPLDFWKKTITELTSVKQDLLMVAESEAFEHLNQHCFHAIYGWSFHHILNDIAIGKKSVTDIYDWYRETRPHARYGCFMHFTSNHDENSWSGSEIERMGEAHQAFAVLVYTLDGIPLVYSGQEEPMPRRLEFFEKDDIGFKDFAYSEFYKKLNNIKHKNAALWNGIFGGEVHFMGQDKNIIAFYRQKGDNKVTIWINLSRHLQYYITDEAIAGIELYSDIKIFYPKGSHISLMPWEYKIIQH